MVMNSRHKFLKIRFSKILSGCMGHSEVELLVQSSELIKEFMCIWRRRKPPNLCVGISTNNGVVNGYMNPSISIPEER